MWIQQNCPQPGVLITVARVHNHWVPFVMIPREGILHVHTWDGQTMDHSCLDRVFACLAQSMGLEKHQIVRLVRMFTMNEGCGAMAIAFIAYMLMDKMLPASPADVVALHQVLRHHFAQAIQQQETCAKPWQWANGLVATATAFLNSLVGCQAGTFEDVDYHARPGVAWSNMPAVPLDTQATHENAGECETLPFKLLTENCMLPETCLHGECGPLPCKLPTAYADPALASCDVHRAICTVSEDPIGAEIGNQSLENAFAQVCCWTQASLPTPVMTHLANDASCKLSEEEFLVLGCPVLTDPTEVHAVLQRVMPSSDRKALLHTQGWLWADDEIRWRMHSGLVSTQSSHLDQDGEGDVAIIDPLLFHGWIDTLGRGCESWVSQNCTKEKILITVVSIQNHWVPFVMIPEANTLHVHAWDAKEVDHDCVERVFASLAGALGLSQYQITRQDRRFHIDHGCGSMAITFLAHKLGQAALPTSVAEVFPHIDVWGFCF